MATVPTDEQGAFQFLDTTNLIQRFYRAVHP